MCEIITKIRGRRRQKLKGLMRSGHSGKDKEGGEGSTRGTKKRVKGEECRKP